jgi:hypothetical protein
MTFDRRHFPWIVCAALCVVAATVLYLAAFHPGLLPFALPLPHLLVNFQPMRNTVGGTPVGLLFGSLALAIFLFAALLGFRKKKRLWRVGRVEQWLRAHIWFTLVTIPLVLFHCGFHWGGGQTSALLWIYIVVMASGVWGMAMQHWMPRLMKERLPREVVFEQIPNIRARLVAAAGDLKKQLSEPAPPPKDPKQPVEAPPPENLAAAKTICDFLDEDALPYLQLRRGERHELGDQRASDDVFRALKVSVPPAFLSKVEEVQAWCDERRRMDLQTRLQHWLHGWLLVHVPSSLLLIVVTLWHALIAVRLFVVRP